MRVSSGMALERQRRRILNVSSLQSPIVIRADLHAGQHSNPIARKDRALEE